jgi:polysaccharide export outer membrane protein
MRQRDEMIQSYQKIAKSVPYILAFLYVVVFFGVPSPCISQNKAYRIGPNDVVTVIIYAGGDKQFEEELTISAHGILNAPYIGPVEAKGLIAAELEKKITGPLAREYFVDPKVIVSVKEYHSLHYHISGAVKKPGLYETTSEATLLELIAKAEGVLPDRGNVAYIMRDAADRVAAGEIVEDLMSPSEPIKIDLNRLLDKGDMTANPTLEPGDVIYIPHGKTLDMGELKIYVEGEVKKPGVYDYQPGMTALSACITAGGFGRFAAPNRTRIIRKTDNKTEVIKIDLNDVREGETPDIQLKPGDRIYIPETWL